MKTRLTISIQQSIIDKAKIYAHKNGLSLSDLIENYLKALTLEEDVGEVKMSPTVSQLRGSFNLPDDFDYKKELTDILSKKHLK